MSIFAVSVTNKYAVAWHFNFSPSPKKRGGVLHCFCPWRGAEKPRYARICLGIFVSGICRLHNTSSRLLHTGHRCCRQAASQVSHTATIDIGYPLLDAEHSLYTAPWNSLPDDLRAQQDYESFRRGLKTWLFSRY